MDTSRMIAALAGLVVLLAGCGEEPTEPEPSTAEEPSEDAAGSASDDGSETGADADGADDAADDQTAADTGTEGSTSASDWDEDLVELPATRLVVETGSDDHELIAKIAAEPDDRRQGLMGVEELPDDAGMLFAFPEDNEGGFWMKDTLIPLDIAFADADGEILAIEHMEPCEEDPCPSYDPGLAYRVALEVPGGWFDERDVEVGDQLQWDHLPEAS